MEEMKTEKKIYNDDSFPPSQSSLIKNWSDPEVRDKVRTWKNFQWLRAKDIPSI